MILSLLTEEEKYSCLGETSRALSLSLSHRPTPYLAVSFDMVLQPLPGEWLLELLEPEIFSIFRKLDLKVTDLAQ